MFLDSAWRFRTDDHTDISMHVGRSRMFHNITTYEFYATATAAVASLVNMYYVIPSQPYAYNSCGSSAPYIILRCLRSMKDMKLRYARSVRVAYSYGRHNTIRMMCARGSYNLYTTRSWSVLHALYSQSDVVLYWIRNRIMCVFQHVLCMCRNCKYD